MNAASRKPETAHATNVSRVNVTDQGSQFRSSRTAVIGTSRAAETARNAGPTRSTHAFMNTLSHGVTGTIHSRG